MKPKGNPAKRKPLSARQMAFVQEYLVDLNATQAVLRAGYAKSGARAQGARMLADPNIAPRIRAALEARAERTGVTADRVLAETEVIAFSSVANYQVTAQGYLEPADGVSPDVMRAVSSVKRKVRTQRDKDGRETIDYEVEFRLWNKPQVLTLAGKHAGVKGFADKLELALPDGVVVTRVERVIVEPPAGRTEP